MRNNEPVRQRALAAIVLALLAVTSTARADDAEDVLQVVRQWAALENDLDAQARLIRNDRVQIREMDRRSDQAENLRLQKRERAALAEAHGGAPEFLVRIESPQVAVYGDTAVVSFVHRVHVFPHGAEPLPPFVAFQTMVLVRERGQWGIAHLRGSTVQGN